MESTPKFKVIFREWLSDGKDLYFARPLYWLCNSTIFFVFVTLPLVLCSIPFLSTILPAQKVNKSLTFRELFRQLPPDKLTVIFLCLAVGGLIAFVVCSAFVGGLYQGATKQLNNRPFNVRDLLSGIHYTGKFMLFYLCILVLAIPLTLLLVLPVFVLFPIALIGGYLLVGKDLSAFQALKEAYQIVKQDLVKAAGMGVATVFLSFILGPLTFPLYFGIGAAIYRDIYELPGSRQLAKDDLKKRDGFTKRRYTPSPDSL